MTTRTRNAIALGVAAAVLAAALVLFARTKAGHARTAAIDLVPYDARVVVSMNLDAIRRSPFGKFLRGDGQAPAGVPRSACDRDALDQASELAVWLPGDTPDQFGIAAIGSFVRDELIGCSRTTIARRGGHPSVTTEGDYVVVGDDDLGTDAARIAARADGVLLLGRPSVRTRMAAVGAGWSPSAAVQGEHAKMRAALGPADVVLTAIVDRSVRDAARRLVGEGESLFDGVNAIGVAADTSATVRVHARVWCNDASACEALKTGLEARRSAMASSIAMRAAGVAGLVEGARIERQDATVDVKLEAPARQVVDLIDRVARWGEENPARPRAPPPSGSFVVPNEMLPSPGSITAPAGSR